MIKISFSYIAVTIISRESNVGPAVPIWQLIVKSTVSERDDYS